jgi:SET domain
VSDECPDRAVGESSMVHKKKNKTAGTGSAVNSSLHQQSVKATQRSRRLELNRVLNLQGLVTDEVRWSTEEETVISMAKLDEHLMVLRRSQTEGDIVSKARTADDFSKFADWLGANGVDLSDAPFRISSVEGDESDNATLYAIRDISEGEDIVNIPSSVMMTSETAMSSSVGRFVARVAALRDSPSIILALHVLAEALDECSSFRPYINVLPSKFTIPFSLPFSPEQLMSLRPSSAFTRAVKTTRAQVTQYTKIYELLSKDPAQCPALPIRRFTYGNFEWAVSVIMTRQNALPSSVPNGPATIALVPVWDMCNHAPGPQTTSVLFDPASKTTQVHCTAMKTFATGDPLTIFYGHRSNVELLLYSGFVQPDNPHDHVEIRIPFEGNDVRTKTYKNVICHKYCRKLQADGARVERDSRGEMVMKCLLRADGEVSPALALMSRLAVMTPSPDEMENDSYPRSLFDVPDGSTFPDEERAVAHLSHQIRRTRQSYQKSLNQDSSTLCLADRLVKALHFEEDNILARALMVLESNGLPKRTRTVV